MDNNLILSVLDAIWKFIDDCSENPEIRKEYTLNPNCFTRNRKLTFKIVAGIILSSLKSNVVSNMERFFGLENSFSEAKIPSKPAFSQQRKKLKFEFFIKLLDVFREAFYENYDTKVKKWKGRVVVSIDGSRASLPDTEEVRKEFGEHTHAKRKVKTPEGAQVKEKSPLGRLSFTYDNLNKIILTGHLVNQEKGEIALAVEDILKLPIWSFVPYGSWILFIFNLVSFNDAG